MNKILLSLILLLTFVGNTYAAAPIRAFTYSPNTTISSTQVNANENALYTYLQNGVDTYAAGSISNAAISASAGIPYSKLTLTGAIVDADISSSAAISASKITGIPPTGAMFMWPTLSAPTGYLICDGSAVSRTTYATLFAIVGTTFGTGDGSTTFNVPNMKHSAPFGYDAGDTNFNAIGKTGGVETFTLVQGNIPSYNLTVTRYDANGSGLTGLQGTTNGATGNTQNISSGGSGTAVNIINPYNTFSFIIKT